MSSLLVRTIAAPESCRTGVLLEAKVTRRHGELRSWAAYGEVSEMTVRNRNLAHLNSLGFCVANSLPTIRSDEPAALRPVHEIAIRFAALAAVFLWAGSTEDDVPSAELQSYIEANELRGALTDDDLSILDLGRDQAIDQHSNTIGWRLENMWSLAWVLGFEQAPPLFGLIDDQVIHPMIVEFLNYPNDSVADVVSRVAMRSVDAVDEMEDLFYCAHNAVRSAQLGGATVPVGFHPITDGGGIHERRHALTWVLSPGTDWDDTDLST
jgi:uncharacterized protein DUF4272